MSQSVSHLNDQSVSDDCDGDDDDDVCQSDASDHVGVNENEHVSASLSGVDGANGGNGGNDVMTIDVSHYDLNSIEMMNGNVESGHDENAHGGCGSCANCDGGDRYVDAHCDVSSLYHGEKIHPDLCHDVHRQAWKEMVTASH